MATLVSPGVDVQIINEAFYGSAGAGTVPLIVFATASNKAAVGSTGVAPGTLPSQAGRLFLATGQRDWVQNYGNPKFHSLGGTPLHGHELNEVGNLTGYSFLGISNRAFGLRAGIDLAALEPTVSAPRGAPISGTIWLDLVESKFGLFQSNGDALAGSAWVSRTVKVTTEADLTGFAPKASYGSNGDFAIVPQTTDNYLYEKVAGAWVRVGSTQWKAAHPTVATGQTTPTLPVSGTVVINGTTVTLTGTATIADVATAINGAAIAGVTASTASGALVITETTGANLVISGTALTALKVTAKTYKGITVAYTNTPQYPTGSVAGDLWVKLSAPNNGAAWKIKAYDGNTGLWKQMGASFHAFNSAVADGTAGKDAEMLALGSVPVGYTYVGFDNATQKMEIRRWNGARYEAASYEAALTAPSTDPEDGTLWYNSDFRADIMVNSQGTTWKGYREVYPETDANGVIIAGSAPTLQSPDAGGVQNALVEGDLWLDSSDLENYPRLYRWNDTRKRWALIDNTDQTTPFGIVFADARADAGSTDTGSHTTSGSEDGDQMVLSNNLDPDAPDPRAYPEGMLLFNTRYSTYNVKVWRPNYFLDGNFDAETNFTLDAYDVGLESFAPVASAGRWVTASGNKTDGSPYMGRKAQRIMVVRSMAEAIMSNDDIRSEIVYFNLVAAPGYPELIDELIALNADNKEVAFIVGDTPARLKPRGSDINNWARNALAVSSTGEDGLTASNDNVSLYYPWGLATNTDGTEVMVPPSTIALRTIAYNDQVAYPWMAPAGFQRGLVTNAASVGYLTDEGEYRAVVLNEGQRDVLYTNKINPIAYIPGRGLVVYGQKTLAPLESALDRINVARLTCYLRYNLDNIVKPFLFEPNDPQTRDSARLTVERFLLGLVGLRALEDYAVLCDETNNTPERRDRNELWIDIVIKPIKAVEFIYIPVRIRNSADSMEF